MFSFLSERSDWEVTCLVNGESVDDLMQSVERIRPDVIAVRLFDKAEITSLLVQLLTHNQEVNVVVVNPENNTVEVYARKQVKMNSVTDLFSAIEEMPIFHEE